MKTRLLYLARDTGGGCGEAQRRARAAWQHNPQTGRLEMRWHSARAPHQRPAGPGYHVDRQDRPS